MSECLPPRNLYASELGYPGGTHIRHHVITYGGYRQVVSAGAFFHGVKKHDRDVKRGVIWNSHSEYDHHIYTRKYMGFSIWNDDVELVEHESIWAFYKYVGYDYKKKKFV